MSVSASPAVATKEMCFTCFDVLRAHLTGAAAPMPTYEDHLCPLFVTWELSHNSTLRGCIGTLAPRHTVGGVGEYALMAAIRDSRFRAIEKNEIKTLAVKISLLHSYEDVDDPLDWDLDVHGISVEFTDPNGYQNFYTKSTYSATYLPGVAKEQGWTKKETLASLSQKAGFRRMDIEQLLRCCKVTRYQSSTARVTYTEYAEARRLE